jgi:aryl-alcohol dehydrogenase-like predicted oxidoreductase
MAVVRNARADAAGTVRIGDFTVRRLGFGAMRLTGPGIWGPPKDHDECIRVLKRAVELGVNFIDTADAYGPAVSEALIAEALHPYPAGLVIATKAGLLRDGPNQWSPDGRPEHLREALEGSLKRLKVDRIDVYQLHRPDPAVPLAESLGALVEMQRKGLVRNIGISNVSLPQLEQAMTLAPIVSVQNRYNLFDRASDLVLTTCERRGLAFLPWRPLADGADPNGRLTEIAKRHEVSPSQIATAWLLARSPAMLPIPGTSSVKHLEENVASAGIQLTADDLRALSGN